MREVRNQMLRALLVAVSCSFCLCAALHAQDGEILFELQAPLMTTAPETDGVINEGEYANSIFLSFVDRENPGNPLPALDAMCPDFCDKDLDSDAEGDEDLSATMYMGHTDEFLFFAFDVTDGFLDEDGVGAGQAFRNDGVELHIDGDADGLDGRGGGLEGYQIVADVSNGDGEAATEADDIEFNNRFSWAAEPTPAFEDPPQPGEFWTAGLAHSETNYHLEWKIPLESIDTEDGGGFTAAKTGDILRMNAVINDVDTEGGGGQDTHAMLWMVEDDPRSPWAGAEDVWVVGLELSESVGDPCDFDGDGSLGIGDIDLLSAAIAGGDMDTKFDVNSDGAVDGGDLNFFIKDETKLHTWIGDSNLDGEFNSGDFVVVFTAGEYEDGVAANSGWAEGDWNADGEFDSSDFVTAFTDGGYELGPLWEEGAAAVPEPSTLCLLALGMVAAFGLRRRTA